VAWLVAEEHPAAEKTSLAEELARQEAQ